MIKMPEKVNPKTALEAMTRELATVREQVSMRERLIEQLETIAAENKEFETRIADAKKTMFMLLHEKLQVATAAMADDYVALVERDTEVISPKKAEATETTEETKEKK